MRVLFVFAMLLSALAAQPAAACGTSTHAKSRIPPPGASIESSLKQAKLPAAEAAEVRALQAEVQRLATTDEAEARKLEKRAMDILGYRKVWLRCGSGTFAWLKKPS
jgi:hypothetical protein